MATEFPLKSPLKLRVSRLENDVTAIYDILAEVRSTQEEHSKRFEKIDQRFENMEQRFDKIDQRFENMEQRFEKIDQRFENMEQRFEDIASTLVEVVRRLPAPSHGLS